MSERFLRALRLRADAPDLLGLPWHAELSSWGDACDVDREIDRGVSRHEVVFVRAGGGVVVAKELPLEVAEREHAMLSALDARALPAVAPLGLAVIATTEGDRGVLVTRWLASSIPYRTIFRQPDLARYRDRLIDAMAILLVRLHVAGFYWGDCSLSNTLFRRDAGELQAFLVDAETSELHGELSAGQRAHDLEILEENVAGDLFDLAAQVSLPDAAIATASGPLIRARYERLWTEITRPSTFSPGEGFRVQERIRALNALGFSVGEVEVVASEGGSRLRVRTIVTDRDYHRAMLQSLTGLVAGERQAERMLNEIRELKASGDERARSVPMAAAAERWRAERFEVAAARLRAITARDEDLPELYCQVLEHKWLASERAGSDVGLAGALDDYLASRASTPDLNRA